MRRKVTENHRNFTIERPLKPEITELEHHLSELKQYILKWSKQDIEKSHKDSDEERHILYSSAKSIINAEQKRMDLLRALVYAE